VPALTDPATDRQDIFPLITFRESAFQVGRADAVTVKADEQAGSTFARHVSPFQLARN
jgi:hypothetical protein